MIFFLAVFAIVVGMVSAITGFSTKFYFLTHLVLARIDQTYMSLFEKGEVSDPPLARELVMFVRKDIAKIDSPEMSKFGLMRRGGEVTKLRYEAGKIDQRENFVGVNPIYGYNAKNEVVLVADQNTFHQEYKRRLASLQQRTAFSILLVAFFLQLLAML